MSESGQWCLVPIVQDNIEGNPKSWCYRFVKNDTRQIIFLQSFPYIESQNLKLDISNGRRSESIVVEACKFSLGNTDLYTPQQEILQQIQRLPCITDRENPESPCSNDEIVKIFADPKVVQCHWLKLIYTRYKNKEAWLSWRT